VVRAIAAGGVTVLMIEHVMQAVMHLAEQVWVLAQGRLVTQGSPSEVTRDPRVIEAYLGAGAAARLARMAPALASP
jgi:branched-chain amino acid transport system ATP-binding protein